MTTEMNRKVRRNPRPLGRGQGARMQISKSTLEVGESPLFKAGFFNTPGKTSRSERLEARVSKAQKNLFLRAATLQGRSLTDFLIASVQEAAERALRAHDMLTLSERDRKSFVAALLRPAVPGKALRQAAKGYKERAGI